MAVFDCKLPPLEVLLLSSVCCVPFIFLGNQRLKKLQKQADDRIRSAFRPRTCASYLAAFRQFVVFLVITGLNIPYQEPVILVYLEYLIQQGLKSCSIRNHVSVLKHYFAMFNWPTMVLSGRKVALLLKSVQVNARMSIRVKGIITVKLLEKLVNYLLQLFGGSLDYQPCSCLRALNLRKLDSQSKMMWLGGGGGAGVHIIVTCSKTMQASNQAQAVQLPALMGKNFCPVQPLKTLLAQKPRDENLPLFQIHTKHGWTPLVAPKAHSFIRLVITTLGLNPFKLHFSHV